MRADLLKSDLSGTLGASPSLADEPPSGGAFVQVDPFRLVDTLSGTGGTASPIPAASSRAYTVVGRGGIPATNVSAVVVDVAATTLSAAPWSSLRLYASGGTRTEESALLTFTNDQLAVSNTGIIPVGADGKISIYNLNGFTDFNIDIQGYFTKSVGEMSAGGYTPVSPARMVDSTAGTGVPRAKLSSTRTYDTQISGFDGQIPSDATAIFANVKVSDAPLDGRLMVGPGGGTATSPVSVNYQPNVYQDSGMTIKLSGDGKIRLRNLTAGSDIHVRVDVQGYFSGVHTSGGFFTPIAAANIYDSAKTTRLAPGEARPVKVSGSGNLPDDGKVGSVAMTVAAANWSRDGAIVLYNGDRAAPATGNLSFDVGRDAGVPVTCTAIVDLADDGSITIKNTSSANVNVRITSQGWFSVADDDTDAIFARTPNPRLQLIDDVPVNGTAAQIFNPPVTGTYTLLSSGLGQVDLLRGGVVAGSYGIDAFDASGVRQSATLKAQGTQLLATVNVSQSADLPVVVAPTFNSVDPQSAVSQTLYGDPASVDLIDSAAQDFVAELDEPTPDSDLGANGEMVAPPYVDGVSARSASKPYVRVPRGNIRETRYYYDPNASYPVSGYYSWRVEWHDYCTQSRDTYYGASFRGPCARHDLCINFKLAPDRSYCDRWLYRNQLVNCQYKFGKFNPDRYACKGVAQVYFQVVSRTTSSKHDDGHWGHGFPSSYPRVVGGPM